MKYFNKEKAKYIGVVLMIMGLGWSGTVHAQTNPEPAPLRAGKFQMMSVPPGTDYPKHMQGWSGPQILEYPVPPSVQADGDEPLCTTCSNSAAISSINNNTNNGLSIQRKADNIPGRPLAITIGLDTRKCSNINLTWTGRYGGYDNLAARSGIQVRYRIGNTGNWTDITDHVYFTEQQVPQTFGPTPLPAAVNDKALVQLQWVTFNTDLFTTGDRLQIDDVTIEALTISNATPVADFTYSANGRKVVFTDKSKLSPTSWSWDFGDGVTSTEKDPYHEFATSGTYNVKLTVTNANGNDTKTVPMVIKSAPIPGFDFTRNGLEVQFTNMADSTTETWDWDFGDSNTSTDTNPVHTYAATGTYQVRQIVGNANGTDTLIKTVDFTSGIGKGAPYFYSLYPNPANTEVRIRIAGDEPVHGTATIMDIKGVVVYGPLPLHSSGKVEIGHLPQGLYYLRWNHPQGTQDLPLMINR